tara:strand:- start:1098 stop:2555 length:1458 start_codon:yes stop_codon:yes gene_type:complete
MSFLLSRRHALGTGLAALSASLLMTSCISPPAARADSPTISVSGPIEGGSKGWIYRSPVLDLDELGYVMEEYFVSGTANSFELMPGSEANFDGDWDTRIADQRPFTTRVFILRPADPRKYNGVLLAHWQNVSAGFENGFPSGDEIFSGYAWMGISAQYVGIYGTPKTEALSLRQWDPVRYGLLEHPGDAYSYDIFAKAVSGALAKSEEGPGGPLGDLKTETIIAVGGSQSALRLASYINIAKPHEKVFDGFLLLAHFGLTLPAKELSLPEVFDTAGGGRHAHWSQINDRGDVPVLVIDTQAEALMNVPARQPDTDSFRFWEIAGAPHTPPSTITQKRLSLERDGIPDGPEAKRNIVEWDYVKDAGIRDLTKWIRTGEAPPKVERLEIVMTDKGPAYKMDANGNVLGGIRPPEVAAAVGKHTAGLPQPNLLGTSQLFSKEKLTELYGNREIFLAKWNAAVDELVARGFVLPGADGPIRDRASQYWP